MLIVATTANETKAWLVREAKHDYTIKIGDHKLGFADG